LLTAILSLPDVEFSYARSVDQTTLFSGATPLPANPTPSDQRIADQQRQRSEQRLRDEAQRSAVRQMQDLLYGASLALVGGGLLLVHARTRRRTPVAQSEQSVVAG